MADVRVTSLDGGEASLSQESLEQFRASLRGPSLVAGDPGYDEVRRLWNGMIDKRPAVIARCTGVGDVTAAVRFARSNRLLLALRGGGHNVAGNASCDGGVMIDLSLMRGVWVDACARTVRVQGGATWGDVDRETQVFGLAVPGGVVSTTGVAGLTLGGGTGWLLRKHGLTIDNLLSVDLVTADGQPRVASAADNADLFWALRGGGGNFGVVTSFEFQAHPVGPAVYLCCPMYPAELAGPALEAWRAVMRDAPEECGASFLFWSIPAHPFFPPEHHGRPTAIPLVVHAGGVEEGERLLRPLRQLGTPLVDLSGPMDWTALQGMFDPFVPRVQQQYYWKSLYLNGLGDEVVAELVQRAATIPSPHTYLVVLPFGGAMSRVGADATAFGRRDMPYLLELDSMWRDPAEAERNVAWTRRTWSEMQRHSTGGLYLNFPGLGEEGEQLVRSTVGEANYQRLEAVKRTYDPDNLFRVNLNVKPR